MSDNKRNASVTDPRRHKSVKVEWHGMIGRLTIGGEHWGAVEWSEKRQAWCIEDAQGRCLSHSAHVHAQDTGKAAAVALAKAMIADGRLPSPQEAKTAREERIKRGRERREKQPSYIKRQEERAKQKAEQRRLWDARWDAEKKRTEAEEHDPLYQTIVDALDLGDPELWKSNSFARLRNRLVIELQAVIANLECGLTPTRKPSRQLQRAREVLALLQRP